MGGVQADISPDEAADGVFNLTVKKWNLDDEIYMDYRAQPMNW